MNNISSSFSFDVVIIIAKKKWLVAFMLNLSHVDGSLD